MRFTQFKSSSTSALLSLSLNTTQLGSSHFENSPLRVSTRAAFGFIRSRSEFLFNSSSLIRNLLFPGNLDLIAIFFVFVSYFTPLPTVSVCIFMDCDRVKFIATDGYWIYLLDFPTNWLMFEAEN